LSEPRGPRKVALVIGNLELGGAETQLVRLANGLDRARFRPIVVCLGSGGGLEDDLAPDTPVFKMHLSRVTGRMVRGRVFKAVRVLSALRKVFRRQRPDIVHGYLPAAYVLGAVAARAAGVPVVIASRRGLTAFSGIQLPIGKISNRMIDLQICNSEAVREYAIEREGLPRERTRVVYNGIDVPDRAGAAELPGEWNGGRPRAVMVANLRPYKGHQEVLQAVAKVVESHPDFLAVLVGDGVEGEPLTRRSRELGIEGNVVFAGRRRNAAELMSGFDFTLLGSSQEGFPNVVMESMVRGVPVVSTDVGGVGELVTEGVTGLLVPFGDVGAMAKAIGWMIEHPHERRRMGSAGRERIASEFSTGRMIASTEAIYTEVLSRRLRRASPELAADR
jgi:glycosyltransferase involved in cell wall biosynthesis